MKATSTLILAASALLLSIFFYQDIAHQEEKPQAASSVTLNVSILYGMDDLGVVYKIDVMTCVACPVINTLGYAGGIADLLVLPNGNILVLSAEGLRLYTPPNENPVWSDPNLYTGAVIAPNGTIYLSAAGQMGLYTYDPVNNDISLVGAWPVGITVNELFFVNGTLYGICGIPLGAIIEVNLSDPLQSVIVQNNSPLVAGGGTTNGGYTTAANTGNGQVLYQYNFASNSLSTICDLNSQLTNAITGLSDVPAGFNDLPCQCTTFAGDVENDVFNICLPSNTTVPYEGNSILDADDILRYILFSDTNDTLGSIVVQSSSTTIDFNPATMQTGVTYYLATIAGDNLNGSVDLDDPCLDISDEAAQVTWRPQAAVVFNVGNPNICVGKCTTVTATFTGTPPFTLTYTVFGNTVTETFNSNSGSFEVCVPAGAVQGGITLSAVGLEDAWCACQ
jgi:hypothetical protein